MKITKEALTKVQKELARLKEKRKQVVERLSLAKEFGDLSENSEYADARDEQSFVENKIQELEVILRNAEIVEKTKSDKVVSMGSIVEVETQNNRHHFEIVGIMESDPSSKRISAESPLGKALLGKKVGEKVTVETPAGKETYLLIKIGAK